VAAESLTAPRVDQHFSRQDNRLTVRPELRQLVLFARHNLLEDAPFTKMDLVVCRNTLIYFQGEAQERVMRRLQYALVPQGLLFLGSSESLGALQPDFLVLDAQRKLYRLMRPVMAMHALRDGLGRSISPVRGRPTDPVAVRAPVAGLVEAAQQALMQGYVPLSLLLTPQRQLIHAWGHTERYLRMPGGQPNLDVMRMLPSRLGAAVGQALHQVARVRQRVELPPVWLELDGQSEQLRVVARPVSAASTDPIGDACVLVTLEPLAAAAGARAETGSSPTLDAEQLDRLAALERELSDTRLTLQSSVEELEAANEELQATNEELMSANEELQSTNEELQSVNEELYTVNAEYNAKLDQVNSLHADLQGMSQATCIATLFVDERLSLMRFTPEATLLFPLRASDLGRPLTDFKCRLEYPQLLDDLRKAVAGAALIEREVNGPAGVRFLARVLGYGEASASGRRAVVSLIDISRVHDALRLQQLLDSLPDQLAVVDTFGIIVKVNRAWTDFGRANSPDGGEAETAGMGVGTSYLRVLAQSSDPSSPALLRELQALLTGERTALRRVYPCHSATERRWFLLQASRLDVAALGHDAGAVISHTNITSWVGQDGPAGPVDL
jgi:two-component system CheB/CheR fusion protein